MKERNTHQKSNKHERNITKHLFVIVQASIVILYYSAEIVDILNRFRC